MQVYHKKSGSLSILLSDLSMEKSSDFDKDIAIKKDFKRCIYKVVWKYQMGKFGYNYRIKLYFFDKKSFYLWA